MSVNLMYSPLETIFQATMEREGRTVTSYTDKIQFQAFMRRNDDGNNYEDRITLFYSINEPVKQGSLITYGNKIYILINRDTEENDCYYKSSALACNGTITLNDGNVIDIPCYASSMKDGLAKQTNLMSAISGNMEFITEFNELSQKIQVDDTFNEFGRTFKVDNMYHKDGILYLVTKVTLDEKPYEKLQIVIDGVNRSYKMGETAKLKASLYVNNNITKGAITWKSSNNSIATIDEDGTVIFLANGYVVFTAYWGEKNYSQKTEVISVGKVIPVTDYKVNISGQDTLVVRYDRTYTVCLYDSNGVEINGTWTFEISCKYPDLINTIVTNNIIKIKTENNDELLGEDLILIATETNTGMVGIKIIKLIALC